MPGHSVPLAAIGGFILLFGFLAFNGGSEVPPNSMDAKHTLISYVYQAAISGPGNSDAVARAVVNTILGGCSGGLTVLFTNRLLLGGLWSYSLSLNGTLAGMVAQCAGCNVFQPWAALIVGVIGGCVFLGVHFLMLKYVFGASSA